MKSKLKLPIKVGKTYYTRDGKKVRIYATDGGEAQPIHGAILYDSLEWLIVTWNKNGKFVSDEKHDSDITHEEWEPQDKELVWCWDNYTHFYRELRFYDSKNNRTFREITGERRGASYDNYEPFEGEWPDWAKEAYERLED